MKAPRRDRARWIVVALALLAIVFLPMVAMAGPRSGGSFGGRQGFRSSGGSYSGGGYSSPGGGYSSGGYGRSYGYGGGSHFFFLPSWGGGYGGFGGGMGLFGSLFVMAIAGFAVLSVVRALRRASRGGGGYGYSADDGYVQETETGRAYLYRLQLAIGRSGRGVQERLAEYASQGDTSTEAGLASLLQQTALELLREKDAVRYVGADGRGPMSLTNAETTMNSLSLAERSRFQVERVRAADGHVRASTTAAEEGKEALELVVVTLVAATRTPLENFKDVTSSEDLEVLLRELGGISPDGLLGLEVVWTPADANDSLTEMDVMTTYPDLRGI